MSCYNRAGRDYLSGGIRYIQFERYIRYRAPAFKPRTITQYKEQRRKPLPKPLNYYKMLNSLLLTALLRVVAAVAQAATNCSGQKLGSATKIPFGKIITSCTTPKSFALSFNDGPFQFTTTLLDLLKNANIKATFFIKGDNFGKISESKTEVQRILNEGHQIGSHTYI